MKSTSAWTIYVMVSGSCTCGFEFRGILDSVYLGIFFVSFGLWLILGSVIFMPLVLIFCSEETERGFNQSLFVFPLCSFNLVWMSSLYVWVLISVLFPVLFWRSLITRALYSSTSFLPPCEISFSCLYICVLSLCCLVSVYLLPQPPLLLCCVICCPLSHLPSRLCLCSFCVFLQDS